MDDNAVENFHIFVVTKKKSVVHKVRKYITIRKYTKREVMNQVEFIIELIWQVWIVCTNYLKNIKNRIMVWEKFTHVETVCLLSKLKSTNHIEVELNMDELDLTVAEKKATYEEIKAYVLENAGLKVSDLYIAQIKQKYGIIERENYNKPKNEDAKQPKCPLEKETAIVEALKHFGMI